MGALDDAIREHLELKRRHGASEDEIRQAEAEALGPARRAPAGGVAEGETALDEGGMPAPVEAFEPPPSPGSAVHDAPPPPEPVLDDAVADPAAVPPRGVEREPLVPSPPLEALPAEPPSVDPLPVEPLHGAVAASEVEVEEAPVEPPPV